MNQFLLALTAAVFVVFLLAVLIDLFRSYWRNKP